MQDINNPIIGIDLLKMLMLQLYSNPRCIYREYIQNALDSINAAVREGILKQVKDGRVSISITKNDISIEDNGTGIPNSKAAKLLTDIANSVKNGIDTAGQFGVGRLSGGGYCETLEFETTYQGEDLATIVSLDTMALRHLIETKKTDISAEDAMRQICTIREVEAPNNDHKFIVRLKQIINSRDILLDVEEIKNYIKEYAPIDYSAPFNSLINTCPQKEFVERHKELDKIRVSLNEYSDIEKGYGLTVIGTNDPIEKIRYFELPKHPKYGSLGWGWYAVTAFSIQINEEKDCLAGIRLRKHNISLDKNILNPCFKETRGNNYFYGEIFITNDNIVPDSGRQGLAASEESDALMTEIKQYFSNTLHHVYHRANKLKTALNKVNEVSIKINDPSYSGSVIPLTNKLKSNLEDFNKLLQSNTQEEIKDIINIYTEKYNAELKSDVERFLLPKLLIKEKIENDDDDILSIINNQPSVATSTEVPYNKISPIQTNSQSSHQTNNISSNNQNSTYNENHTTPQNISGTKKQPKSKIDEILASLDNKYSQEQIALLKRVFSTMLVLSSSSNKKNIILLMESAVNSL